MKEQHKLCFVDWGKCVLGPEGRAVNAPLIRLVWCCKNGHPACATAGGPPPMLMRIAIGMVFKAHGGCPECGSLEVAEMPRPETESDKTWLQMAAVAMSEDEATGGDGDEVVH